MITFRRDKLRRLIEAGKIVLDSAYHFDDMMGERRTSEEMPVAMAPQNRLECKDGICYIFPSDLVNHGRAWLNPNGTVTLIVHSNCNYTFRILP